jgi:hypothetical protein
MKLLRVLNAGPLSILLIVELLSKVTYPLILYLTLFAFSSKIILAFTSIPYVNENPDNVV